jgi:hypothetical protein
LLAIMGDPAAIDALLDLIQPVPRLSARKGQPPFLEHVG